MASQHGYIKSFMVTPDDVTVIMTVHDPGENQDLTIEVTKAELMAMYSAGPLYTEAPPQTPTPARAHNHEQETRS